MHTMKFLPSAVTVVRLLGLVSLLRLSASAQSTNPVVNVRAWGVQTNVPSDLTNAVAIAAGIGTCFAVRADGTVVAWGDGPCDEGAIPAGLTNVSAISVAQSHGLALKADGTIVSWGGTLDCSGSYILPPPSGLANITAVACGGYFGMPGNNLFSLALRADGTVVAWGSTNLSVVTSVPGDLTNVVAISANCGIGEGALALKSDGSVETWGDCCGPLPPGLTNVVAISAGYNHNLALRADGIIIGWGENSWGESSTPPDLTNAVAIAAGSWYSVAIKSGGQVVAWGYPYNGVTNVPVDLPSAISVSAGNNTAMVIVTPGQPSTPPLLPYPPTPQTQTAAIGTSPSLSIRPIGVGPFSYQWYFGTNALPGATNQTLVLPNIQLTQSGTYTVVVSNTAGSTTSLPATVSVIIGLDIIGMTPTLTLRGTVNQTYRLDYLNAIGPTNAWLPLATITITNNPQLYFDVSAIGQPSRLYRLVQLQ